MAQERRQPRFRTVGDGGPEEDRRLYPEELQLALRNRGMPLEALRYPITPVGLHYLLTHFDIPYVAESAWSLKIGGLVRRPLDLTLADIKAYPRVVLPVTLECAGNGRALMNPRPVSQPWLLEAIGTAEWAGTPLRLVLEDAGIEPAAVEAVFTGLDRGVQGGEVQSYQRSLKVGDLLKDEVLLAYEMNGAPLQPQHGFPLRLVVPGWYGMTSVKWLDSIEMVERPFEGYQMVHSYRYSQTEDDPGTPVDLIKVRALMIPPGVPDFMTRARLLAAGAVTLTGRAWAGPLHVSRVEVSTDGGPTWADASLEDETSRFAWRGWSFPWTAEPGRYNLMVRATDERGRRQPETEWNYFGMGNNMVQSVEVIVE